MTRFFRRGVLTAALLACASSVAFASTFTVTTNADTTSGSCGATCSLRDAIAAADADSGGTIVLGSGVTYLLTAGVLHITSSVTIEGNGSIVDGGQVDRVLDINGTAVIVVINNLTITHGKASGFLSIGGGIFIRNASVTLNTSTVIANSTEVENGEADDGGGIAAVGTFDAATGTAMPAVLTLNNTTVSNNSGSNGGGLVCVLCQLQASNSAFSGNTSMAGDGAGIMLVGDASTAQITSSAFSGNGGATRGGGLATSAGTAIVGVTRTRFASNGAPTGGGIFNNVASVTATNNWWGCNFGPGNGGAGCAGAADNAAGVAATSPYLVLKSGAAPASVQPSGASTLTADLTSNSDGVDVSPGGTIPDGTMATFAATLGTFALATAPTSAGKASDLFTAGLAGGTASLSVSIDNQTVSSQVQIGEPLMTIDQNALLFNATTNGTVFLSQTGAQTVHLTQSGAGAVTWTATSTAPWLVVAPTSGSGSGTLNVSVQFAPGLTGSQGGSINLSFTGAQNIGPITVTLVTTQAAAAPFGAFDTPLDGSTGLAGSIAVTGWALDDHEVTSATICRDSVPNEPVAPDVRCGNEPRIFLGNATFVDGARPDVQAVFPNYPFSSRAGWGYLLLTNFLPNSGNGTYNLHAYASDADGNTILLGNKTITCDNAGSLLPFGAIDTPAQGGIANGAMYANFGWVLAPAPGFADPPDGGSVSVMVDGAIVGSPGAWNERPDLTALFPAAQYPGIGKALGVFGLDTTALADGLHTIAWIVTTNTGLTAGVGSRFFTVANGVPVRASTAASLAAGVAPEDPDRLPIDRSPISGRRGFDLTAPLDNYAGVNGVTIVQAEELDRIELHLGSSANSRYSGYLRTPAGLSPLPIGSQLDPATGVFVWQPGVAFVGTYEFVFTRSLNGQAVAHRDVKIVLNPMRSTRVGPQTVIDVPGHAADGGPAVVSAAGFVVTGWAADLSSTVDNGVDVVHVWATRLDGGAAASAPVFVGPALVNGSRPDVGALFGARFGESGYGIVVRGLAPGTYDIAVFAYSTELNGFGPAQTVRVVVR